MFFKGSQADFKTEIRIQEVAMTLPLTGIRILDLTRMAAGPFCTQILADFGAEVIKIETRNGGDGSRHEWPRIDGVGANFYTMNRNKKSLTLDLQKEDGKKVFTRLAAASDVIIEQFRPGVMQRLGLDYECLKEVNPRIIYCALTGYGSTGPLSQEPGHDINFLNLSGVTDLSGEAGGPPVIADMQIAALAGGGLNAALAVLLAVIHRNNTGIGQYCDVSMLDGTVQLLAWTLGIWSGLGEIPKRGENQLSGGYACYHLYRTGDDKYVGLGAHEPKFWGEFCEKICHPEMADWQWTVEKQEEAKTIVADIMAGKTRDEWTQILGGSGLCFTPVQNLAEMAAHPQIAARSMIMNMENFRQTGKNLIMTGVPIKLSESPGEVVLQFPELGGHAKDLLVSLGYSDEEVEQLQRDKVI
ncbi:MAG: CaiB/BaiF CoA transferase family protein [Ignavibacteriales bacterium]